MDCKDVRELLYAYADNELDAMTSRDLAAHLQECSSCDRVFAADRAVKTVLANPALRRSAAGKLREQLTARILPAEMPRRIPWHFMSLAASLMIVFAMALFLPGLLSHRAGDNFDAQEALASHLRSLQTDGHLMDVQSTDQHTVKPWFDGKLDFAPPVHDLANHGFPLVGGRLDFLHDRPVAALVYRRNKHIINLFIWPGESGSSSAEKQGYNITHWSDGGMTFWAVSDLNAPELQGFANLFRAESSPATLP